jgi:Helix-turn-helix domain
MNEHPHEEKMDTIQANVTGRAPGASIVTSGTRAGIDPDELLDSTATAQLLRVRPQTLASWRVEKRGPPYVKIGRACYYVRGEIHRWLAHQLRNPTP